MFVIQLPDEPHPLDPEVLAPVFVGRACKTFIPMKAVVIPSRQQARAYASGFRGSKIVNIQGMHIQRLEALMITACKTPEELDAYMSRPVSERQVIHKFWVDACMITDTRATGNYHTVEMLFP